jgi:hypothetical protein
VASFLVAAIAVIIVLLIVWLTWPRVQDAGRGPSQPPNLPQHATDYLASVDRALDLPAELRTDIRAELADHLVDSMTALEAEGVEPDRAAHEAVARLGNAEDLARQLRAAHQTTRRLLAGAAGGVFQAGVGFIGGTFLGAGLVLIGVLFVGLLVGGPLKQPVDFVAARLPAFDWNYGSLAANSAFSAAIYCVAAWMASRMGVKALARGSRRSVKSVRYWWAAWGALVLGWLVLFVATAQQSWIAVAVELAVPLAFVAGAVVKTEASLGGAARKLVAVLVVMGLVTPLLLMNGSSSSSESSNGYTVDTTAQMAAFDRVAPSWTGESMPSIVEADDGTIEGASRIERTFSADRTARKSFTQIQFELWRAVHYDGAPIDARWEQVPDPGYSTPFAVQPATQVNGRLAVSFDLGHIRASNWLLFVTGIGPDGHRYRLAFYPESYVTSFDGTVWDWFTASSLTGGARRHRNIGLRRSVWRRRAYT